MGQFLVSEVAIKIFKSHSFKDIQQYQRHNRIANQQQMFPQHQEIPHNGDFVIGSFRDDLITNATFKSIFIFTNFAKLLIRGFGESW